MGVGHALDMPSPKNYEDKISFAFILDHLLSTEYVIKPMFGCHGVYAGGRLCLFLMDRERPLARREKEPMQKGIYIATISDHVAELMTVFPAAEFEFLKQDKVWIFVSVETYEFEQYVIKACEMIVAGDPRIGR